MTTLTITIDLDDHSLGDVATALRWFANSLTAARFDSTLAAVTLDGPIRGHEGQTVGVASTTTDRPTTGPAVIRIDFGNGTSPEGGYAMLSLPDIYPDPAAAWAAIRDHYPTCGVPDDLDQFGRHTDTDGDTWHVRPAT